MVARAPCTRVTSEQGGRDREKKKKKAPLAFWPLRFELLVFVCNPLLANGTYTEKLRYKLTRLNVRVEHV